MASIKNYNEIPNTEKPPAKIFFKKELNIAKCPVQIVLCEHNITMHQYWENIDSYVNGFVYWPKEP